MTTSMDDAVAQFDLTSIWQQLSSQYDAQSLIRVRRWIESLVAMVQGEAPDGTQVPPDPLQRPRLLYLDGLNDAPWFDTAQFDVIQKIERNFDAILAEFSPDLDPAQASDYDSYFSDQPQGKWRVRKFYDDGARVDETFRRYPTMGALLESPDLPSSIGECQASAITAGGRIAPHFGPVNGILVGHLALRVPEGDCRIRVGDTERGWTEGKCFVFDDTYEHEVWNNTDETRYVVLFNLWHPDLTAVERNVIQFLYPRSRDLLNTLDAR